MAYTSVSKTDERKLVRVQLPSSAFSSLVLAYKTPFGSFLGKRTLTPLSWTLNTLATGVSALCKQDFDSASIAIFPAL
jgi:hypothetical protein